MGPSRVTVAFRPMKYSGSQSAYCEYASTSGLFMTDSLAYRSAGAISQGDIDLPDSLAMDISSAGSGSGLLSVGSRSMIGIGNTTALGYVHSTSERVGVAGNLSVNGKVRWSSFTSPH
jgi:hypothetical protein